MAGKHGRGDIAGATSMIASFILGVISTAFVIHGINRLCEGPDDEENETGKQINAGVKGLNHDRY